MKNAKAPVVQEKTAPAWVTTKITCWSEKTHRFADLTLEESVQQTRDEWDRIDYVVQKEMFEEDQQGIKSMMKGLGYYLISTANGATFQHYTRKVKIQPKVVSND